ncbi:hypothetical protein BTO20_20955 [Mycobacterium dioxanotrophicus]|uniref:Uncharacterized protein n=1 Tax=Mycobacterium dioxanotrophicus TaxID=482462 RepID=A0A1Y0C647_9MYCO|nr:hypothetical protein BTO20_20955 [Mycobacterium dioxanotrophicus]
MLSTFKVGDRVGAEPDVLAQMHRYGDPDWPGYGHIVSVGGQSLIWVRDHLGGEWGLPASSLHHID